MFIKVERSTAEPCVTLSGPIEVLGSIQISTTGVLGVVTSLAGSGKEIRLTGHVQGADNSMFLKAAFLEEVLKRGFIPASNVTDDLLVLSREVNVDPGFI